MKKRGRKQGPESTSFHFHIWNENLDYLYRLSRHDPKERSATRILNDIIEAIRTQDDSLRSSKPISSRTQ